MIIADQQNPVVRRAVMYDVARLAGVSHQTVSRVINDSAHVRAETRHRVVAAMRKLDYRPNSVARALATGRSKTIGILTFTATLYSQASTLLGIERAAHAAGYLVSVIRLDALDRASVRRAIERLRAIGIDGLIVIAPDVAYAHALRDWPGDLPVVALETRHDGLAVSAGNQYRGARLATEYLLELGHTTVHHLAGPPEWLDARRRVKGWRDALDAAGAPATAPVHGDWSPRSGYELAGRILQRRGVTAIFVANDQMALGALRLLREQGREVPGDVSIVGFDDIPDAEFFCPPLTTVRQDFDQRGRRALDLLLAEISAGGGSIAHPALDPTLVVRASTSAPACATSSGADTTHDATSSL
jgi:DNA-binding LacI/PurR family transcriptional regulator